MRTNENAVKTSKMKREIIVIIFLLTILLFNFPNLSNIISSTKKEEEEKLKNKREI